MGCLSCTAHAMLARACYCLLASCLTRARMMTVAAAAAPALLAGMPLQWLQGHTAAVLRLPMPAHAGQKHTLHMHTTHACIPACAQAGRGAPQEAWPWQDIMALEIENISDTPSFIFLWWAPLAGVPECKTCASQQTP